MTKSRHFWTIYHPLLVNLVCEWPLKGKNLFKFQAQYSDLEHLCCKFDKRIALSEKSNLYLRTIIKALLGAFHCRKTYCWSFNSPIILMCKSFGQRLIDNHLWRSKSRRQLLNIGCHKNSLQSWRIGPFLNTCSSLDLSLMNLNDCDVTSYISGSFWVKKS